MNGLVCAAGPGGQWSETTKALETLIELCKCSACNQIMKNVHSTFTCEHFFCEACIKDEINDHSKCPECQSPAWIKDIRANPQIQGIVSCCESLVSIFRKRVPTLPDLTRALSSMHVADNGQQQLPTLLPTPAASDYQHEQADIETQMSEPEAESPPHDTRANARAAPILPAAMSLRRQNAPMIIFDETTRTTDSDASSETPRRSAAASRLAGATNQSTTPASSKRLFSNLTNQAEAQTTSTAKGKDSAKDATLHTSKRGRLDSDSDVSSSNSRPASPAPRHSSTEGWSCASCTLSNAATADACTLCAAPRRASTARAKSAVANRQSRLLQGAISTARGGGHAGATHERPLATKPAAGASAAATSRPERARASSTRPTAPAAPVASQTATPTSQVFTSPSLGRKTKRNPKGETSLHVAAKKGAMDRLAELLEAGENLDDTDNAGWTPLHEACTHGHVEAVRMLLQYGANVNFPGFEKLTPLHEVLNSGDVNLELVRVLLEHGANPDAVDMRSQTPRQLAAGNEEILALLNTKLTPAAPKQRRVPAAAAANTNSSSMLATARANPGPFVVLSTGLQKEQRSALEKLVTRLGGKVVTTFDATVTHVVTESDANRVCPRTLKYVCAVLAGLWIVSFDWITECSRRGAWVAEEAFEIQGAAHGAGAPTKGRLNREAGRPRLFEGCTVYLVGEFKPPALSVSDLELLVRIGGGQAKKQATAPSTRDHPAQRHVHAAAGADVYDRFVITEKPTSKDGVHRQVCFGSVPWLLDCVTRFELFEPVPV
ncbi:hypothetical protein CAOG_00391 [Capsaspora owczarzaki ATCC 30864]|uniref:RanBP-type and C3HC4-type zinc finger-containing protein 1 n=1 Tax=Capsaspora owczarzaki (strain ATCC 30864) TaxID=595528 RepID=A0A0D2WH12_CAPO3|nr:hypothetical protein CAOG_00391 [Capsaspora owczarzaki ATCC 30864]KJE88810.1 hypothetical protein CAOG_000391 [Capsaspora owczarzaki ATCC 30864]|eukprot:XP_004365262.1 hypothetical protein CAOG_00391 [Capsaspora owczarzaki ATCC 30864]